VNVPGPCKCVCGFDAGGDLRVTEQDFTGRLVVTEDAGPDDQMFCPVCDRELIPEEVVERTLTASDPGLRAAWVAPPLTYMIYKQGVALWRVRLMPVAGGSMQFRTAL
jgi:hypothetical protein